MSDTRGRYFVGEAFDEREEQETDYGRLWFATPSRVYEPRSVEELASILKQCNRDGTPVTVRNTGHSMNGQTVTDGVQVRIGDIRGVTFIEDEASVEAHCGDSWDSILKAVRFPEWCPPVFPNNPGQRIHMAGTIAAGGIGAYSASRGGFWNHVTWLMIVTMEGEVVECSREKNSELFQYSLAGWGRVGIIVKFRVSVEKSKHGLVAGGAFFHSPADFFASYQKLAAHPDIDLLSCQIQFSHHGFLDMPWAAPFRIGFGYEAADERDALEKSERVRDALRHDIHFFGHVENDANVTFTMTPVLNPKHYAVYVFPEEEATVGELSHIWHDYLLPRERFMDFVTWSRDAVREHGLQETFLRQPFFHSLIHVDMCGGYSFKHLEGTYPLVPEIRAEDTHTWHINYSHNVPRASIPSVIGFVDEASTRCYRDGGKRYLYGTHRLGRDQVVAQYGLETIHAWNGIKKQTDPKLLMNRGVIPHLDEML